MFDLTSTPRYNVPVQPTTPLPVGVIGTGRMGRLHTRVYSQMPQVKLVGVYDADTDAAQAAADQYDTQAFTDLQELLAQVQAVTIATPTTTHLPTAQACIERNIACLIEKPLAKNSAEAQQIVDLARSNNTLVQVGHIERFNPAVRAMERLGVKPRFIEVTRISPLTFRSIDVGVVLDMMIHDIDIVLKLSASTPARIDAIGVSVIGDVEDICNARLEFENGCVANITASRVSLKTERKLRVFSPNAYVSLDYQKKYAMVANRSGNLDAIRDAVGKIRRGEIEDLAELNYHDLINIEELAIDDVEPLRAEQESFISAIVNHTPSVIPAEDGLAAVRVAEQIVAAIKTEKL